MSKLIKKIARKAATSLARGKVKKFLNLPPAEAFEASWKTLRRNRLYRFLIEISQNHSSEGSQLNGRTFEILSAQIPDFKKLFGISISDNLKQAIESRKPFLIVQLKDGHRFVSKMLADRRREYTRIVSDPARHYRLLHSRGIGATRAHFFKDDILSLLHLRRAIKNNNVVCCVIDYMNAKGEKAYLNPAIFSFANRMTIPIFFVKSHVDHEGQSQLISSGPHIGTDALVCANEFLEFFNSVGNSRTSLEIRRYNEHRDWDLSKRKAPSVQTA